MGEERGGALAWGEKGGRSFHGEEEKDAAMSDGCGSRVRRPARVWGGVEIFFWRLCSDGFEPYDATHCSKGTIVLWFGCFDPSGNGFEPSYL